MTDKMPVLETLTGHLFGHYDSRGGAFLVITIKGADHAWAAYRQTVFGDIQPWDSEEEYHRWKAEHADWVHQCPDNYKPTLAEQTVYMEAAQRQEDSMGQVSVMVYGKLLKDFDDGAELLADYTGEDGYFACLMGQVLYLVAANQWQDMTAKDGDRDLTDCEDPEIRWRVWFAKQGIQLAPEVELNCELGEDACGLVLYWR